MLISPNVTVDWTQKVDSISVLRDPLGIWSHHLSLQEEFTAGITSVTPRARYYTLWAYYYQYLRPKKIIDASNFEKIFLLSSLAHHDGDTEFPGLISLYNKEKFIEDWDEIDPFTLDFHINGYGRVYYNRQMEVFRCVWTGIDGKEQISKIDKKLADTLSFLNPESFSFNSFSKKQLKDLFSGLCICCISENQEERDILSKLMFGFFYQDGGEADISEVKFSEFQDGQINLDFVMQGDENYYSLIEQNSRRRNTLFLFLQIIKETNPHINQFNRFIWDAIYFSQNRETKQDIDFKRFEKTRIYWEFFQLNVYYVFLMEKILERINLIVLENIGVNKRNLLLTQEIGAIYNHLSERLECTVNETTTLTDLFEEIGRINLNSKSSLESIINESQVYDNLRTGNSEYFFSECLLLLGLLKLRYEKSPSFIVQNEPLSSLQSLEMEDLFNYLDNKGSTEYIFPFLSNLTQAIINRHLFVSAQRFAYGTKNWIFTEEDERLYSARTSIRISPRDNRWRSIRSILTDLGFIIQNSESKLDLTEKGATWLSKIQ